VATEEGAEPRQGADPALRQRTANQGAAAWFGNFFCDSIGVVLGWDRTNHRFRDYRRDVTLFEQGGSLA